MKRVDAIREYLEGKKHFAELSLKEREYYKHLQLVESMQTDGKTDRSIRTALFESYDLSDKQARTVMREVHLVFGDLRQVDRMAARYRASQMALRAYEMAMADGNYGKMVQAVNAYMKAEGLENEDPDLPQLQDEQPGPVVQLLPEGMEELILKQIQSGTVNQTEAPPLTIDITHEEMDAGT